MTASNSSGDELTDQSTHMTRIEFDWSDIKPSMAVIETIAKATDQGPTALEPLYGSIDPDALNRLIQGNGVDPEKRNLAVSFTYAGYTIAVLSTGLVELNRAG